MQRVGEDDALDRRVRDVALVPERDVLEPGLQVAAQHPGEPAQLLATSPGCACAASRSSPSARRRGTAPRPRAPRCAGGGGSRARTTRRVAPTDAHAYSTSAWRSRASTWVAGTGVRPSVLAHVALDRGIDVGVRADRARQLADRDRVARPARSRSRSRRTCSAQSASLAPNVVGSAWMPWVRPTIGVSRNSRARVAIAASSAAAAPSMQVDGPRQLQRRARCRRRRST